ncbi:hypothetical protein Nepgr_022579 [Nepenthes gracilis]|uniref:Uncharacterized protein n=1 Tax=Nepenthes gracilis TaxID=150966 RepID=A0AAD3T172_NEPGR|nr:hypothetical protein Nepgr_022579 [Nepenthes gracilis]
MILGCFAFSKELIMLLESPVKEQGVRFLQLAPGEFFFTTLKGGSSSKVVDCIHCLKGYYEWKQAGGIGVWRYGGTVKVKSFHKEESSSSSICKETAYDTPMIMNPCNTSRLSSFSTFLLILLMKSPAAKALSLLFDRFGLHILAAYLF